MKRISWNKEAEHNLKAAIDGDADWIRREVNRGISALYKCADDGYIVLRYERDQEEVALVLGEGKNLKKWVPIVEELSRKWGAKTIRTHIQRPGIKRLYESLAWRQREIVMEKTL